MLLGLLQGHPGGGQGCAPLPGASRQLLPSAGLAEPRFSPSTGSTSSTSPCFCFNAGPWSCRQDGEKGREGWECSHLTPHFGNFIILLMMLRSRDKENNSNMTPELKEINK